MSWIETDRWVRLGHIFLSPLLSPGVHIWQCKRESKIFQSKCKIVNAGIAGGCMPSVIKASIRFPLLDNFVSSPRYCTRNSLPIKTNIILVHNNRLSKIRKRCRQIRPILLLCYTNSKQNICPTVGSILGIVYRAD